MEKLNQILNAHVADGQNTKNKLLGAGFMVLKGDEIIYQGAVGRTGLSPDSAPWTLDTLTMLASMTKLPAIVCILQVVERGLLTLDEDVRPRLKALAETQILRGFDEHTGQPIYEENTSPISLRTLLSHTTGFAYDLAVDSLIRWRKVTGNTKIHNTWTLEALRTPFLFTPGTEWHYGTSIDWATLVLEQVTGQSLNEYATANIFQPLGMKSSFIGPANAAKSTEELLTRLAIVPFRTPDEGILVPGEFPNTLENNDYESGGAGLLSTANDYAKFLQAVLQPGKLLTAENMELLFKPQLEGKLLANMRAKLAAPGHRTALAPEYTDETSINVSLGGMLNVGDVPGKRPGGSIQWSGFMNSHWWIDPKNKIAAVLNVSVQPFADPVAIKLYDELERAVYGELLAGK